MRIQIKDKVKIVFLTQEWNYQAVSCSQAIIVGQVNVTVMRMLRDASETEIGVYKGEQLFNIHKILWKADLLIYVMN